jgi:hypothetical protein
MAPTERSFRTLKPVQSATDPPDALRRGVRLDLSQAARILARKQACRSRQNRQISPRLPAGALTSRTTRKVYQSDHPPGRQVRQKATGAELANFAQSAF